MNIYLIKFLNENQTTYVTGLRKRIKISLEKGDLSSFNEYWNELKIHFYSIINSFDGEVIL